MKELALPIKGMHCKSCELIIGQYLEDLPDVKGTEVSLKTKTATIYADHFPPQRALRRAIQSAGYDIGYDEKPWFSRNTKDYINILYGGAIIVWFAVLLKYLHVSDLSSLGSGGKTGGVMALFVGLAAGFSTCMALVGGLVLGLSARHAEKHPTASPAERFRPHIFFNLSRIITFFVLGGIIGLAGSFLSLKGSLLGGLTIGVGIVMLLLGLQLTEIFPRLSNGGLTLPSGLAKFLGIKKHRDKEYSHKSAAVLGGLSFFLPCGFTQAMQLYAISTGSFMTGAAVMGLFAIGTAPGLLSVGGLTSVVKGAFAKRLFKVVGVAVVAMAIYNIGIGYTLTGWPKPFSSKPATVSQKPLKAPSAAPPSPSPSKDKKPPATANSSTSTDHTLKTSFRVKGDISPRSFTVKANEQYVLAVDAKEDGSGCMSTIMIPGLVNQPEFLKGGETNKLEFTATRPGSYKITCAMGIPRGTITVI
jgi:sulfite exporter TauE/SafE/copper chaperone CopZ